MFIDQKIILSTNVNLQTLIKQFAKIFRGLTFIEIR